MDEKQLNYYIYLLEQCRDEIESARGLSEKCREFHVERRGESITEVYWYDRKNRKDVLVYSSKMKECKPLVPYVLDILRELSIYKQVS